MQLKSDANVFDVGAGSGEIVELSLCQLMSGTVHVNEPNALLLEEYLKRVRSFPNLTLGKVLREKVQELYDKTIVLPPQNLILSIHMIYELTMTAEKCASDPKIDLIRFARFLFNLLAPSGKLFLAFADQNRSLTGLAAANFFTLTGQHSLLRRLESTWDAREALFGRSEIETHLNNENGKLKAKVTSYRTDSFIYGQSQEDLAIMCITGELGSSGNERFDTSKLSVSLKFIQDNGPGIGLTLERRDIIQNGMYRCNQPQIITIISKEDI